MSEINDHEGPLLVEAEAASLAYESERNFRQRRYAGTGPAFIQVGKKPLYRRSAVIDWLIAHEQPSGGAATT